MHVRFARVRFVLELFFVFETKFFPITRWEFDLIRRAHLLCILKRHHTYGVNTFVCSYSLNPNPSHSLVLSSLLDWQPYLLCGFAGLRGSSRETRSRSRAARPFFHPPLYDSSFIPLEKKSLRISYSINPNPSHSLYSLRSSIGNPACFAGFRDSSRETRSRSARTFRTSNNILPNLDPDETSSSVLSSGSHRGQSKFVEVRKLSAFALSPLLPFLLLFFFFFFFFFFAYNPSVMRIRLRHQRQH